MLRMALRTLSAAHAAALDAELMGAHAFSVDQLMELTGLAVAHAVQRVHPPARGPRVLVVAGPGNNGGDGLVAARHLRHAGYRPFVSYPKPGKAELYRRLAAQLRHLDVPVLDEAGDGAFRRQLGDADFVVDAIFGFSFSGEVREPFPDIIALLEATKKPVLAVDAPSSWNIEDGPPREGPGHRYQPQALISLTAPKPLVNFFKGRHFIGGRFLPPALAEKYEIDPPPFEGTEQVVEVNKDGHRL